MTMHERLSLLLLFPGGAALASASCRPLEAPHDAPDSGVISSAATLSVAPALPAKPHAPFAFAIVVDQLSAWVAASRWPELAETGGLVETDAPPPQHVSLRHHRSCLRPGLVGGLGPAAPARRAARDAHRCPRPSRRQGRADPPRRRSRQSVDARDLAGTSRGALRAAERSDRNERGDCNERNERCSGSVWTSVLRLRAARATSDGGRARRGHARCARRRAMGNGARGSVSVPHLPKRGR